MSAPLKRVWIANRGEIAVRVLRALRERGVESVVGYSDADADSLAVHLADHAVRLGPGPATESYLAIDTVVAAARERGCDAVHPGYGFLSERAPFVRAVEAAGMRFLGPAADTIEILGDKVRARKAAQEAGVPVVPGTPEAVAPGEALEAAEGIGFPLLVKAAAGGGGRGMRLVREAAELEGAVTAAAREAASAFGDDAVFLERYLERPRHVEIQVLADGHGNAVHLFERECSIQRRHQKVIEEAPSPIPAGLREEMGEAAVRLCRELDYVGAGTVEFLVDGGEYFFLEVNTRIQVEHPVTEAITGVDLVDAQLEIGAGRPLPFAQVDLEFRGHAIEARLYAEDPCRGFLPSPGELLALELPQGPGVRVDAGFRTGDRVSEFYDSMLAKVVAFGSDREHARRRLVAALKETVVLGVTSNLGYLLDILEHPDYVAGACDVHCLERWMPEPAPRRRNLDAALLAATYADEVSGPAGAGGGAGGPRALPTPWETLGGARL